MSGSSFPSSSGKKTKGKQKIEIKKIENEIEMLVSFSKRRSGIYKKSSELSILCGAEIAFIVFSPAGKPFAFGHPSVEYVTNRFQSQNLLQNVNSYPLVETHKQARIDQISQRLNEHTKQLDEEKQRVNMVSQQMGGNVKSGWWDVNIDQVDQKDLHGIYSFFEKFCNDVLVQRNEKIRVGEGSSQHASMDPSQLTYPFHTNANVEVAHVPLSLGNAWISVGAGSSMNGPMGPTITNVDVPPENERIIDGANSSQYSSMAPPQFTNPFLSNTNVEPPYFFIPPGNKWITTGASSSQHGSMGPTQFLNPFPPSSNAQVPEVFPSSGGQGHQQFRYKDF